MNRALKSYFAVILTAVMLVTGSFSAFAQPTELQPAVTEAVEAAAAEDVLESAAAAEAEESGAPAEEAEVSEDAVDTEEATAVPENEAGEESAQETEETAAGAKDSSKLLGDASWEETPVYWGVDENYKLWISTQEVTEAVAGTGIAATGSFPANKYWTNAEQEWGPYRASVSEVEVLAFDENGLRTKSTGYWFKNFTALTEVHMEKLNTAYNDDMSAMFYGCTALRTLDISRFSFAGNPVLRTMFYGCSHLETIYSDSQTSAGDLGWLKLQSDDMFTGCVSLVGSGRGYSEDTKYPYRRKRDHPEEKTENSSEYAQVNGYFGNRGYFTEKNDEVAYDGVHVRFNHKWIDYTGTPDGSITVNLAAGYGAKRGWITLYRENGIVNKVVLKDVQMDNRDYRNETEEQNPAVLYLESRIAQDLTLRFEGDNDIIYVATPTEADDSGNDAMLLLLTQGSRMTVECAEGSTQKLAGFNVTEYDGGIEGPVTEYIFNNLNMQAHQYQSYGFRACGTKMTFNDCLLDIRNWKKPTCMVLEVGNGYLDPDDYTVVMNRTKLVAVNEHIDKSSGGGVGADAPSALSISHVHVTWNQCNVELQLPYAPIGQCRGLYMLNGGLTMHGGTARISSGDRMGELPQLPKRQALSAAIQAVYVTIDDNAEVDLTAVSNPDRSYAGFRSAWGIVYSQNVIIEDAKVNILASGSDCKGLYYYGRITAGDALWEEEESELGGLWQNQLASVSEAYHPYGDVILRNSDVCINVQAYRDKRMVMGITGRHLYVDLPYNSQKKVQIITEDLHLQNNLAVMIYNMGDANITLQNGAFVQTPQDARPIEVEDRSVFNRPFYTYVTGDGMYPDDKVTAITFAAKTGGSGDGGGSSSGSGRAKTAGVIGSKDAPVTAGSWIQAADGSWSYSAPQLGQEFKNVWAYIANPYAGGKPDWFFFDPFGKMLTGWQWLFWNGAYHCYYLNPMSNGMLGACQLGGVTPDGYTVDGTGAWTVDGKTVTK